MAETLLNLIKNIIKENRDFVLEESYKYKKLKLINSELNNEFKKGIDKKLFLPYFKFYLRDKVLFDSDEFDYIIINVGIKFINSILNKLIYINTDISKIIDIENIDNDIKKLFELYYLDYDVIIYFEISDNEARLVIMTKDAKHKLRNTCKVYQDFPFYNMFILDY